MHCPSPSSLNRQRRATAKPPRPVAAHRQGPAGDIPAAPRRWMGAIGDLRLGRAGQGELPRHPTYARQPRRCARPRAACAVHNRSSICPANAGGSGFTCSSSVAPARAGHAPKSHLTPAPTTPRRDTEC
ncbi:hypothetical protein Rsub_06880 [Raphidocelis subcapitata]|uniref:Uncharacterized protein n=1 Tax=Raphidocelis subcapitata TaxID=307507 RepID=A0A2V0P1X3_9CHLO|nr:hypothetical protein Rsub_06880 [Raphidocelis subcapitata]|eukprot:GBF93881.1 hypothetical protein Rsub_06880 [Raphidocelis subcapitata]